MLAKIALLASIAASARAQLAYTIEVLPTPPGTIWSEVHDVGGLGRAVGEAHPPIGVTADAVLWSPGAQVALLAPPIGAWTQVAALGVSSSHAVGIAWGEVSAACVATRWTGGVPAVLPVPPGTPFAFALAVADNGVVAGWYSPTSMNKPHACIWSNSDVFQALPEPVGAFMSKAVSIRADGTVLGWYRTFVHDGICAWTPAGQLSVLAPPSPSLRPEAMAADGSVYGTITNPTEVPFRLTGGVVTVLPTLTWQGAPMPFGSILDANSSGRAVGWSKDTSGTKRATLWHGSNAVDLQSLVPGSGNWMLLSANAIDDSGRICGMGVLNGAYTAFLLHPAGSWSFCTAGTTTNGCVPSIGSTGTPQVGQTSGFVISVAGVDGQRTGILFYGVDNTNFTLTPWAVGSSSFLCVKAPTQRTITQGTGGTFGQCDGALTLDWLAFMAAHSGALGQPLSVGQTFYGQGWFRDPPAPKTTNLSDALTWVVSP